MNTNNTNNTFIDNPADYWDNINEGDLNLLFSDNDAIPDSNNTIIDNYTDYWDNINEGDLDLLFSDRNTVPDSDNTIIDNYTDYWDNINEGDLDSLFYDRNLVPDLDQVILENTDALKNHLEELRSAIYVPDITEEGLDLAHSITWCVTTYVRKLTLLIDKRDELRERIMQLWLESPDQDVHREEIVDIGRTFFNPQTFINNLEYGPTYRQWVSYTTYQRAINHVKDTVLNVIDSVDSSVQSDFSDIQDICYSWPMDLAFAISLF